MRGARDFVAVAQHVRPDRVRKTGFGNFWCGRAGEIRFDAMGLNASRIASCNFA